MLLLFISIKVKGGKYMKLLSLSRFKKICVSLLACATVVSATIGILSFQPKVSAASTPATRQQEGISFVNGWDIYETKDVIKTVPKTYEAVINLPTSYAKRAGIIVGNYKNATDPCFNFELQWGSNVCFPKLHFDFTPTDGSNPGAYTISFTKVDVRSTDYVHLVAVLDTENRQAHCYLNGELKQTVAINAAAVFGNFDYEIKASTLIGGDRRGDNAQYFKGKIKGVELYSDARTAEEIASDYQRFLANTIEDSALMADYDFTQEGNAYLNDLSGNGHHLYHAPEEKGLSFGRSQEIYEVGKMFENVPSTYEAYVSLPTGYSSRSGIITSNFTNDTHACFSFEVYTGGYPKLYFDVDNAADGTNTAPINVNFTKVDIRTNGFVHLAIVLDKANKEAHCYVNGELKQTVTVNPSAIYNNFDYPMTAKHCIGGDNRAASIPYFRGTIGAVELYSDVRTAEEIKADYERLLSGTAEDENLMADYDFLTGDTMTKLTDKSNNGYDIVYSGEIDPESIDGMTFNVEPVYLVGKKLETAPNTFEAEVFLPKTFSGRAGSILGNWGLGSSMSFEVNYNGNVRFYHTDSNGKDQSLLFDKSDIRTGKWAHVAVVHDKENNQTACYIDGKLVQTLGYFEYGDKVLDANFCLGGDNRSGNAIYFKGWIRSVTAYSDARTAEEIAKDAKNGTDISADNIILHYNTPKTATNTNVEDLSGNGYNVIRNRTWFEEKDEAKDYAYSFAVVGDTQIIADKYPNEFHKIYDWILDNKDSKKIAHVFGLGDITDKDTVAEWVLAKENISKLNGKISYSLVRGNHDSIAKMNSYFSYDEYTKQFKGFYTEGDICNSWMTLTVGETDYLIFTLDYGASNAVLAWAGDIIESFPHHRVIITTHAYLYRDGTTLDQGDVCPPATSGGYNNGDHMWDKFISKHGNIFLVLSGHDPCDNVVTTQTLGDHGNVVTQMLIDPQGMDASAMGATGMVAMLYFSEDGKEIEVEFYSTIKNQYYKDTNQYKIDISGFKCVGHKYDQKVATKDYAKTPATCLEQGVYYYSCVCGLKSEETFVHGELANHRYGSLIPKQEGTCSTPGVAEHYKCSVCEKCFDRDLNEITDLGVLGDHIWNYVYSPEEHYQECTECGELKAAEEHKFHDEGNMKKCECGYKLRILAKDCNASLGSTLAVAMLPAIFMIFLKRKKQ